MRLTTVTMRRGFTLRELIVTTAALSLLTAILVPSLARARDEARDNTCSANLRQLGAGCHIYSNDYYEWFPHHYYETDDWQEGGPPNHGVDWIGAMGSHEWLSITQNSKESPKRNHPSRSLFMLIIQDQLPTSMFICPESGDKADPLENYGTDSTKRKRAEPAVPGQNRFDFLGYKSLSYGYQLPYGPRARPNQNMDSRMALAADKGPYYTAGKIGKGGTRTVSDQRSRAKPPERWLKGSAEDILARKPREWRKFNSANHKGKGQNVLFMDGHVAFKETPLAGVDHENIYTLQSGVGAVGSMVGIVPGAGDTRGPLTATDSFIVP